MFSSVFNDHLYFFHRLRDFTAEQFIPHYPVEGFTIAILPAGDICGLFQAMDGTPAMREQKQLKFDFLEAEIQIGRNQQMDSTIRDSGDKG